tara:strand:+ start:3795 stop:4289 length:495 start_codon:yes stop_codon:yes gene_type:complete
MAFFLLIVIALITACLASSIAEDKGHSAGAWGLCGFLFGPLGLIAAAGLSDRKLRRYIRQIGEKQEAIQEPKTSEEIREEERKEKIIGTFQLLKTAEEDAIWEKILSMLSSDLADKADRSNSYLNEPLFGGTEFVVNNSKGERLAFASRIEGLMNNYQWEVSLE